MTFALDDLHRARFDWPDSLVIELIGEAYGAEFGDDRLAAARVHARFLRLLVGDPAQRTARERLDLIAFCAARGVSADAIEAAEQAVFGELTRLVEMRFRNAPRLLGRFLAQLQGAQAALPKRTPAPRRPEPVANRAPLRLRRDLASAA